MTTSCPLFERHVTTNTKGLSVGKASISAQTIDLTGQCPGPNKNMVSWVTKDSNTILPIRSLLARMEQAHGRAVENIQLECCLCSSEPNKADNNLADFD